MIIKTKVIKVFDEQVKDSVMTKLMVVSWNDGAPRLVKQSFWRDGDAGEWNYGKLKGLDGGDLFIIMKNLKVIKGLLNEKKGK